MIKTQEKTSKELVLELRQHHQSILDELGKSDAYFYPKMAYRPANKDELYISCFPSELYKGDDIYTEFVNREYIPEDSNRTLWVLKHNPFWKEEYELTIAGDKYLIPVSELTKVNLPKKVEEVDSFKSLSDFVDDSPINDMTIRHFATIMLGKPVSKKQWLNKLITDK